MGRVLAWLRDDPGGPYGCGLPPETPMGEPVVLPPEQGADAGIVRSLSIRERATVSWTDDGAPEYEWLTVFDGPCQRFEQREEFDDEAGFTLVKARATVAYAGAVSETAVVITDDGWRWRVTAANPGAGSLVLDMNRIDAGG